jgi:hypothetical protein
MSLVNILNVQVLDNPAPFQNPIQLEVTFECIQQLEDGNPNLTYFLIRPRMEVDLCRLSFKR